MAEIFTGEPLPDLDRLYVARPPSYLGQVATRCRLPDLFTSGFKALQFRTHHRAGTTIKAGTTIQVGIPNWYVNTIPNSVETGSGAPATVYLSLEFPAGTFTRLPFNGAASGTIPDLTTGWSDATPLVADIPEGVDFWINGNWFNPNGVYLQTQAGIMDALGGDKISYSGTAFSDLTLTGGWNSQDATNGFFPCAIIGQTTKGSVAFVGDSRAYGNNDTTTDGLGDVGEVGRALGLHGTPYISLATPGDQIQKFVASNTRRVELMNKCSAVHWQLGINDIANGRTSPQVLANFATARALVTGKVHTMQTIPPNPSATTDTWATVANQTVNAGTNPNRNTFNDAIRAGVAGVSAYFEVADVVESARNSGKWKAPGYTADGIHETQAAYLAIRDARVINPAVYARR